jgi:hypothetical protein
VANDNTNGSNDRVDECLQAPPSSSPTDCNGVAMDPTVSDDGRYVAFRSTTNNFDTVNFTRPTNGVSHIYIYDRNTGDMWLASRSTAGVQGNDGSYEPFISGDGRYVVFSSSATNLTAEGGELGVRHVYRFDRVTNTTVLVDRADGASGAVGNTTSRDPSISDDGDRVAWSSASNNLVPGDTNGETDVFVRVISTNDTRKVSQRSGGSQLGTAATDPEISGNGTYVVYLSRDNGIVAGDSNSGLTRDVFVVNVDTLATTRANVNGATQANGGSDDPTIDDAGLWVAFKTNATNLGGDGNGEVPDIYVAQRDGTGITIVTVAADGTSTDQGSYNPQISGDGMWIVYESYAKDLVTSQPSSNGDAYDQVDIYMSRNPNLGSRRNIRVSLGNQESREPDVDEDGSVVVYQTRSTNFQPPDNNNGWDIVVTDPANT